LSATAVTVTTNGAIPDAASSRARSRQLRIAQVVTKLSAGAGGITLRGALALDPDRYHTTILTGQGGPLAERADEAGLRVVHLRHMTSDRRVYPWDEAKGLRELMSLLESGGYDLVHTHSARAGALGRIAARRAGVPAIVHSFHGFPFHSFQSFSRRRTLITIERRLGRITDYFLTDGTFVAAEAVRLKLAAPDRIRAITSPIDDDIPQISESTRHEARRRLGVPLDAKVVGTVARLEGQKAPERMVAAMAALRRPDVFMVWVGDGDLRPKVEGLVNQQGLEGRFLLLGDRSDVSFLLPGFDVFALSSLFEGLPCAVVEAMSCGVPVVATAVNSVPEIVVPGKTGLLARAGDPDSLARAIGYVLDHPADAARMAEGARASLGDRFRAETLGRDLTEVYELALEIGAARSPSLSLAGET